MTNRQEYLGRLQAGIEKLHNCRATYRRMVLVQEVIKGRTLWKGEVEVFWLTGHPQAKRCFAWANPEWVDDDGKQFAAVLEIPPVIGPATAVKSALAAAGCGQKRERAR